MNTNPAPLRPEFAGGAQRLSPDRHAVTFLSAARPEVLLAELGLVLIAVHVIDDNFVQPQPGTSAGSISSAAGFAGEPLDDDSREYVFVARR
jgi:hypothetical protein